MSINRFAFVLSATENERYLVRKGVDMQALLRALAVRRNKAVLFFGETDDRLDSEFLGVNPYFEELVFSPGDDPETFERLLTAGSFGVETSLDSIRILFIATHAEVTQFKDQKALRARIPDVLARMQRREALRVATPKDKPSFCAVRVTSEPAHELRLRVEDVSVGGIGLVSTASQTAISSGKTYHDCSLELPGIGLMRCTLNVVYVNEAPAGSVEQRIGCHFIDLPGLSREQVRSYVARLERAHLAAG
jgi:c-di-GMP-binding flagellar brake protein YcgR